MKKNNAEEKRYTCCVCGEEHGLGDLHDIHVKEQEMKIRTGCVDIIHRLV
jgi:hypothetical protein